MLYYKYSYWPVFRVLSSQDNINMTSSPQKLKTNCNEASLERHVSTLPLPEMP